MNQKKLIGTIIGVLFFAVLIAGATFAWFTFSVNVSNGNYNAATGKFSIDYVGGGEITSAPIVTTGTPENATVKQITAKLSNASISGKITIKLTTSSTNLLTTSGAINYAICKSASDTSTCTTVFSNAVATGSITASGEKILYDDKDDPLTTATRYYFVYFWLDGSKVTAEMVGDGDEKKYSGYIHASGEQTY